MSNSNLEIQVKQVLRRCASIEKKQDLQDQDRQLLEDISIQLADIDQRLKNVENYVKNSRKDLKEDIANVGEQVVASMDDLTTEVAKTPKIGVEQSLWGRIKLRLFKKKGGKKI